MEESLKKEKKFQEVLSKLKKMPDDVDLNREIAILYIKRQQVEKAEPIREKMPDDVDLNREFGIYYLGKDELEKALEISEKIPDDVDLNREFGIYYLGKKQINKALEISELIPDDVKLNNEFAMTYLKQRLIEKALPYSQKVFDKDPENTTGLLPALHLQIGATYANMIQNSPEEVAAKNGKNAVMHLQAVVDKYPDSNYHEYAHYYLGVTYSLTGDFDKSIEILEKLMNHATNDRVKQNAGKALQTVKQLAAEAKTEDGTETETVEDDN